LTGYGKKEYDKNMNYIKIGDYRVLRIEEKI
jgi:hypothetical protein